MVLRLGVGWRGVAFLAKNVDEDTITNAPAHVYVQYIPGSSNVRANDGMLVVDLLNQRSFAIYSLLWIRWACI